VASTDGVRRCDLDEQNRLAGDRVDTEGPRIRFGARCGALAAEATAAVSGARRVRYRHDIRRRLNTPSGDKRRAVGAYSSDIVRRGR
jgi:hypothetical protein